MQTAIKWTCYILISIALILAIQKTGSYPFYVSWDMDLVLLQDLFLLLDDQLPVHYAHPGFGMNFIMAWAMKLAQSTGFITTVNISNLGSALQPLLVVAEQIEFLRIVNSVFCILLAVLIWKNLCLVSMNPDQKLNLQIKGIGETVAGASVFELVGLIIALLTPSLWDYQMVLIRTETYSIIFWLIAFYLTLVASRKTNFTEQNRYLICVGLFSCLSFLSKIQSFFMILLLPFIFIFFCDQIKRVPNHTNTLILKLVGGFVLISALSLAVKYPNYLNLYFIEVGPTKFIFVLLGVALAFYFEKYLISLRMFREMSLESYFYFCRYCFIGSALIIPLAILFPTNIFTSIYNLIFTIRSIFFWQSPLHDTLKVWGQSEVLGKLTDGWPYFVLLISAVAGTAILKARALKKHQFIALGFICLVVGLHFVFAVRHRTQDSIWIHVPVTVLFFMLIRFWNKWVRIVSVILFAVANCYSLIDFKTTSESKSLGYYDPSVFFHEVYPFGQYEQIFSEKYDSLEKKEEAVRFAKNWENWKFVISKAFPYLKVDLKNIQPFENGVRILIQTSEAVFHYTPDQNLAILFEEGSSSQLSFKGCTMIGEVATKLGGKNYVKRFIRGNEFDPRTLRLLPTECIIYGLDAKSFAVIYSAYD